MLYVCWLRFRPAKGKQDELRAIIERFKNNGNYDRAWKALTASDCLRTFFLTKSAAKQTVFKEHVCSHLKYLYNFVFRM